MRRRPATLLATALVAAAVSASALLAPTGAGAAALPDRYVIPGDAVFPEGIAVLERTGTFWVSSTTDGTIYRGKADRPRMTVFSPGGADGRTTAIGLEQAGGYLFVAGGATGHIWVYNAYTGALEAKLATGNIGFINDVAIAQDGAAYFTDSVQPFIYRVSRSDRFGWRLERWLGLEGTVIPYNPGFNLNGIANGPDRRYLYVVHSPLGRLFRIDTRTKAVVRVDLGGKFVVAGDGVERRGDVLYIVQNSKNQVTKVRLHADGTSGTVISRTADPSLHFPTTAEALGGRLLIVNSQFDRRGPGLTPELPFTVSSIRLP